MAAHKPKKHMSGHKKKPIPKGSVSDAKFDKVMGEFKRGTLKTSAGTKVTERDQALAIAASEARRAVQEKRKASRGR